MLYPKNWGDGSIDPFSGNQEHTGSARFASAKNRRPLTRSRHEGLYLISVHLQCWQIEGFVGF